MRKILLGVVLLGAAIALSFGVARPSLTSPVIVASGQITNRTTPLPAVPMYTTTADGVYRISYYATITKTDPNSQSVWGYNVEWSDSSNTRIGHQNVWLLQGPGNFSGAFYAFYTQYTFQTGVFPMIVQARKGTTLLHSMTQTGPPDASAYNLYWVVEQIQ